jgi:FkbM family methyltransferase
VRSVVSGIGTDVENLAQAYEGLRASIPEDGIAVLNDASGALAVSRFQPAFRRMIKNRPVGLRGMLEEVDSPVGRLLFPAFDRFILPSVRDIGTWEPAEADFLRSVLKPGMLAVGVGANVGYTALLMAGSVGPTGLVVALEPEPLNFQLLEANVRRNRARVFPVHAAAGQTTGSIILERSPDNAGDHRTAHHPMGIAHVEVPLVALDDLFPPDTIVDVIVIDAQGFDHLIIRGMKRLLADSSPHLLVEFWPVGIINAGDDPDEVLASYQQLGYTMRILPDVDVSGLTAAEIVAREPEGKDYVTLAMIPDRSHVEA